MLIFIDESGDHNLSLQKLDNKYNLFVLGAFCISEEDYIMFEKKFNTLKTEFFGSYDFIIHTAEITRPNRSEDPRNKFFNNPDFRKKFYSAMNELIAETHFSLIICAIDKEKLIKKYGEFNAEDPYLFSIENLLNRILWKNKTGNKIFPEKRGYPLDNMLELQILKYKTSWTAFHRGAEVSKWVEEFVMKDKKANLAGQQMIDLLVTPIGRHILGKPYREGNEIDYNIIKTKIARKNFTIFP